MTNRSSPFDAFIPSPENPPVAPDFTVATNSSLPILAEANPSVLENDCWNKIGVKGDRSCSELSKYVHCRNCPVFTAAGQRLFERKPPAGHLAEWTKRLAEPEAAIERGTISVLVFRIGDEWLAADISLLVEIAELRPIHTIPHRSNSVLAGLVNIRGELPLCVSLGGLLGIEMQYPLLMAKSATKKTVREFEEVDFAAADLSNVKHPPGRAARATEATNARISARLMLMTRQGQRWAFQVDEVEGVSRFTSADLTNVPSTVSGSIASFSKGVFWHNDRRIGFLDEVRLFDTLARSLS